MKREHFSEIRVFCYASYRGDEEPRRLLIDDRKIKVEILNRWTTPEHRYFKVLGDDCRIYTIRQNDRDSRWELTVLH
jgi:hypothetical protein